MLKSPYQPCIPTRGSQVPAGPDWVHEIKHDGFRLIVQREGDRVRLFTRNGYDWSKRYPLITEAAGQFRAVSSFVIDGEAVILRDSGLADFDALRSKRHDHEVRLVAFDLLAIDGEDIRPQPLHARKVRLAKLLGEATGTGSPGIQLSEYLDGGIGPEMFEHACKLGLEGIVSKRRESAYNAGPTSNWIKIKNPKSPAMQRAKDVQW
jgi:bifunctional non-homologous end joining protein LigD